MSLRSLKRRGAVQPSVLFAALADDTRLALVGRLSLGEPLSIVQLTRGSRLTRQAITKHLRVLKHAGVVRCFRKGREARYELRAEGFVQMRGYLEAISQQWDQALLRLKGLVEE